MKGMTEVMRGCGIGCDFCEVTLRPLRYYSPESVAREIAINTAAGQNNAWLHSDEIFAYKHGNLYEPNEEALAELMQAVMSVKGLKTANPTHGRISIPAGYPDLIKKLSTILKAGPSNWIGVQTGVETGSDKLAKMHMPNKTLPLKIGPDGTFSEIVWQGVYNETKYFWRPAFTIQVGQEGETPEDLWETISMINVLSNSYSDGRPFEFTITPLLNVPLGRIKSHTLNRHVLSVDQLAVYYASYRHLAKMAARDGFGNTNGNFLARAGTGSIIAGGGLLMMKWIERVATKAGVDIDKVKNYSLNGEKKLRAWPEPIRLNIKNSRSSRTRNISAFHLFPTGCSSGRTRFPRSRLHSLNLSRMAFPALSSFTASREQA
ncbi:Fe-S oxidoreductase, partial [mine drainage metagenome]